jgi:hypothetical protein
MFRLMILFQVATLGAALSSTGLAEAQQAKSPTTTVGKKVPMHPSTLTLRTGRERGHTRPIHPHYSRARFHQPTPIHGAFAGPRM